MIKFVLYGLIALYFTQLNSADEPATINITTQLPQEMIMEAESLREEIKKLAKTESERQMALKAYLKSRREQAEAIEERSQRLEQGQGPTPSSLIQPRAQQTPQRPSQPPQNFIQRAWSTMNRTVNKVVDWIAGKIVAPFFRFMGFIP